MRTAARISAALIAGTGILVIGMSIVEHFFWAQCSGVDIHRYHELWMCWNFLNLWVAVACVAGFVGGLLSRKRGLVLGVFVALAGLGLYSVVYRYPFGTDHLATLRNGLLFFVLPCAIGGVLGARLMAGSWKYAL